MQATDITYRPATWDDLEAVVDAQNSRSIAVHGEPSTTIADERREWEEPGFDVEKNILLACSGDHLLAFVQYANDGAPWVRPFTFMGADAGMDDPAIYDDLIRWAIDRARQDVPKAPPQAKINLVAFTSEQDKPIVDAWQAAGFEISRRFYQMRIEFDAPPPPAVVPEGYRLRPIREDEHRDVFEAVLDAFRDHYGFVEPESHDEDFKIWSHYVFDRDDFDPELQVIAEDPTGSIAGISLNNPSHGALDDLGWVATLGVLKPHRKRGLGEALLRRSFEILHAKGKPRAGLGVDATSLTNATALYERCGMHQHRVSVQLSKTLRDGEELANMG